MEFIHVVMNYFYSKFMQIDQKNGCNNEIVSLRYVLTCSPADKNRLFY
jgi:hypothetical protein